MSVEDKFVFKPNKGLPGIGGHPYNATTHILGNPFFPLRRRCCGLNGVVQQQSAFRPKDHSQLIPLFYIQGHVGIGHQSIRSPGRIHKIGPGPCHDRGRRWLLAPDDLLFPVVVAVSVDVDEGFPNTGKAVCKHRKL